MLILLLRDLGKLSATISIPSILTQHVELLYCLVDRLGARYPRPIVIDFLAFKRVELDRISRVICLIVTVLSKEDLITVTSLSGEERLALAVIATMECFRCA